MVLQAQLRGSAHDAAARPALGRDVPQRRRAAAARIRAAHRPRAQLHDPRPRRLRGPDGAGAPGAARHRHVEGALPRRGDVRRDLLALRERGGAAARRARRQLSLVRAMGRRAAIALRRLRRGQAGAARARLRRPAAVLGRHDGRTGAGGRSGGALRPRVGRRVPGHQSPAGVDRPAAEARRPRRHGGRRRRAGDLRLSRGHGAQHPRLSRAVLAAGRR